VTDAKDRVEQEDPLLRPVGEVTMPGERNPEIVPKLTKEILQGWRGPDAPSD
jgi:hypothetical protein